MPTRDDEPPTDEAAEAAWAKAEALHEAMMKLPVYAVLSEATQQELNKVALKFASDLYTQGYNDGMVDAERYRID